MFQELVMVFIPGIAECFLQAYAYGINVEKPNDMEHVYANSDLW